MFLTDELGPAYNRCWTALSVHRPESSFWAGDQVRAVYLDSPQTNDEMPVVD